MLEIEVKRYFPVDVLGLRLAKREPGELGNRDHVSLETESGNKGALHKLNRRISSAASSWTIIMSDRRRINGPSGGTAPPVYASSLSKANIAPNRPLRARRSDELRKICEYHKT